MPMAKSELYFRGEQKWGRCGRQRERLVPECVCKGGVAGTWGGEEWAPLTDLENSPLPTPGQERGSPGPWPSAPSDTFPYIEA